MPRENWLSSPPTNIGRRKRHLKRRSKPQAENGLISRKLSRKIFANPTNSTTGDELLSLQSYVEYAILNDLSGESLPPASAGRPVFRFPI